MANFFRLPEIDGQFPWFGRPQIDDWIRLKQYVYARDGGMCQYCLQPTEYIDTHCHHILELSEGGTNHPGNLKTLCRDCHKERHPFMKSARDKLR